MWLLFVILWAGWAPIVAPLTVTTGTALQRLGLRKIYGIKDSSEEEGPQPIPEPKIPRDTSRPYPRPRNSRSKLNRVCPVCGTGAETTGLDGKVLGWPTHASCAEWLGDWKPPRPAPSPVVPGKAAVSITVENSPRTQVNVGSGNNQRVPFTSQQVEVSAKLANGLISLDEARERLNREIVASWGVTPAILEKHTHKAGDPLPIERCPQCGAQFCGTPDYLRSAYKLHLQLGCR